MIRSRLVQGWTLAGLLWAGAAAAQAPAGTAFTYQGRLEDGGAPANAPYDFEFRLFDAATGGNPVGGVVSTAAVAVSDGLFIVSLDFGGGSFNGEERWLEVAVRPAGPGTYTTLQPRQLLSGAPYALRALSIPLAGTGSAPTGAHSDHDHDGVYALTLHAHDASDLVSGALDPARLSGDYPLVTGLGTVNSGAWNASPIDAPHGGTGQTGYGAGDMLFATGPGSLGKLSVGGSNQVLSVAGGLPAWAPPQAVQLGTLIPALPFTISQPGTYYLASNLTGVAGQFGITIAASNVSVELNGFRLSGVPGSFDGIQVQGAQLNVAIRNGVVGNWGFDGVHAFDATNSLFQDLRLSNNGQYGLRVGEGVVQHCTATSNGNTGISASSRTTISDSTANSNLLNGIAVATGGVVSGCIANNNTAGGIVVGNASIVIQSSATGNGGTGIAVAGGPTGGGAAISCAATFNQNGILAGLNTVIANATALSNTVDGIVASMGSLVRDSASNLNGGAGITGDVGASILGSAARSNGGDGIRVTGATVVGNTCSANGTTSTGAGVHATGTTNRIEANQVVSNDVGILLDAGGNLVIRNSAKLNTTDYLDNAAPGANAVGPIVSAGTIAASNNPHANYVY